jgi:hypothetical protein
MAGYSGTALWKKLGIVESAKICVIAAPEGYRGWLAPLPAGVEFCPAFDNATDLVHLFTMRRGELRDLLGELRRTLSPRAAVWVSWPKKSAKIASEVTEDVIRELALPLGFVDIKVCAVSEIWSGLKLVVRKELR